MIDFNSLSYTRIDFNTPIFTPIQLNPIIYTSINFNTPDYTLIFDDLNIPQFVDDETAIATLAGSQTYQLIGSRLVKVTPRDLMSNIWVNLSKAFTYFRRVF